MGQLGHADAIMPGIVNHGSYALLLIVLVSSGLRIVTRLLCCCVLACLLFKQLLLFLLHLALEDVNAAVVVPVLVALAMRVLVHKVEDGAPVLSVLVIRLLVEFQ